MKELTIEQKVRAYDKAVKEASIAYKDEDKHLKETLERIFPELKVSEDERIREAIIALLKFGLEDGSAIAPGFNETKEQALAWLEKQGNKPQGKSALEAIREEKVDNANKIEPKDYSCIDTHFGKPIDKVEPKFKVGDIVQYITDSTDRRKIEEIDTLCNMYHTDSSPIMFEVENEWKSVLNSENVEQNLADKVEPKFHKVDWIVFNGLTLYVKEVVKGFYRTISKGGISNSYDWDIDKIARLWTIQDAKDGDVLATEDKNFTTPFVAIYKSIGDTVYDNITFNSHCFIGFDGNFYGGEEGHTIEDIHPATKEQRKLLSQRMKEAGYEWDAEKKELRKEE